MSEDVLITDDNLAEREAQDLEAMKAYLLESEDALIDTTPIKLTQKQATIEKTKQKYSKFIEKSTLSR